MVYGDNTLEGLQKNILGVKANGILDQGFASTVGLWHEDWNFRRQGLLFFCTSEKVHCG